MQFPCIENQKRERERERDKNSESPVMISDKWKIQHCQLIIMSFNDETEDNDIASSASEWEIQEKEQEEARTIILCLWFLNEKY